MENTKKTLFKIIWSHLLELLDEYGFRAAGRTILMAFIAGLLSAAAMYPAELERAFLMAMEWHDGALPRTVWIWIAVFAAPPVWRFMRDAFESVPAPTGDTIEGMDMEKVIAHLTAHRTFKRDDIERAFGIPRYRYTALVKKLKAIGVLIPGDNNMSVLSEEWTPDALRGLFIGRETAAELERPVRIVRPSQSPTPFTRRIIEQTPMETAGKRTGNACATPCAA
jgi:hypothetical protein